MNEIELENAPNASPAPTASKGRAPSHAPGFPSASAPAAACGRGLAAGPLPGPVFGWFVALLAATALLCFHDQGGGAALEATDCWVAQTAREMSEARSWREYIIPRFSGEVRMQKSPGAYWAVIAASRLRQSPVDESAARTPPAVFGILTVASIFILTRRIAGDRAAVFAGFAAAGSTLILYWSHRASSDFGVAALVSVALTCLWFACNSDPGWRRIVLWLSAYTVAGLGMLYKMPLPLACVGLPAGLYVIIQRRWRVLASGWHLAGIVLFLLPWLPWAIAAASAEHAVWYKWRTEYFDRFTGEMPNVQFQLSWMWYAFYWLIPLGLYTLPFFISTPGAVWRALRPPEWVNRDGVRFVLIWFVSLFAFFSAAAGKEVRYFLPGLPPLFVLLGIELSIVFNPSRRAAAGRDRLMALLVWILAPLAMVAGGFGLRNWYKHSGMFEGADWPSLLSVYVIAAATLAIGLGVAATLYQRRREHAAFAVLVLTMWLFWLPAWSRIMPAIASEASSRDIAAQLRDRLTPEQRSRLLMVASQDSRITWYGDVRFPRVVDQLQLLAEQHGRRSWVYERERIGGEMIRRLREPQLTLLVATRHDYVDFLNPTADEAARAGGRMPRTFLWLQTRIGKPDRQYIVFGNQPPPWPEQPLNPPMTEFESRPRPSRSTAAGDTGNPDSPDRAGSLEGGGAAHPVAAPASTQAASSEPAGRAGDPP